jgi:membrane fusion protein, multidrug efflux system
MNAAAETTPAKAGGGLNVVWIALLAVILAAAGWFWWRHHQAAGAPNAGAGGRAGAGSFPVPVTPGIVETTDVPIYLEGLGTAQAFNTVMVRSRVDGQVQRIAFTEGQEVKTGDLLAQIDPALFQAQLDQSVAKKAEDEAQLAIARLTLARDAELLTNRILAQQDYDTQKALVAQLEALIKADQATIDNAKVQLGYTTITAPLDGRTGIRLVDEGNIVHANDLNGLVVLTQLRPISVVFTLPEQNLGPIQQHTRRDETLSVFALDRDNHTTLGEGTLAVIDNQIDSTTGTIRLKANFPNPDLKLWPGQFVNVRLLLETRKGATVVPASVIQRGPDGAFAFVITPDLEAQVRPVQVALIARGQALIDEGLRPGERVVVDGQYKLQQGSKVKLPGQKSEVQSPKSEERPKPEIRNPKANPAGL